MAFRSFWHPLSNGIGYAVPVFCAFADPFEYRVLYRVVLDNLYHAPDGVTRIHIAEPHLAKEACSGSDKSLVRIMRQGRVIIGNIYGHVVMTLLTALELVAIGRWRVAMLLYQFNLHVACLCRGDREIDR